MTRTVPRFLLIFSIFIGACATPELSGPPRLGMKFMDVYPPQFGGGTHDGLDLDAPLGTPVRSIADGVVALSTTYDLRGNLTNVVLIQHKDRTASRYLHIEKVLVKRGDEVKKGQQIAVLGLNGPGGPNTSARVPYPHLHLEVYRNDRLIDPLLLKMDCKEGDWRWPIGCAGN